MYITFNRFRIIPDRHAEFEKLWLNHETHREEVPGFLFFDLIKGRKEEDCIIYASHTTWKSQQNSLTWKNHNPSIGPIKTPAPTPSFT